MNLIIIHQECSEKHNGRLHRLYSNGSGIPSAGYVVLFDGYQTRSCTGNVAAHAGSCLMDLDTDRPILGYVNVCPGKLKIEYPENRYSLGIFTHEIAHALGAAKKHMKCARLNGVDLENQKHRGPIGSHWEGKTYGNELMTGRIEVDYAVSNMTLGFFEDSG
ncbi:uncharacterized protein DC041_0002472 [Schistosoma bovis]|uniref:Leishmanolysin-like peptidase n=1 Tax=Schistosoma bovis TaxID=6184 RepID=A0A430PZM6_SCHBO|nr:uncharacterized protein DC041_0002472 [Schistosoma bovis]